jgi:protein-L-isoaspartate(D-aspartate) O-methyltransferase
MADENTLRQSMVDGQLRPFDVTDKAVLGAMLAVMRSDFVAPELKPLAYSEASLAVSPQSGRRLLQPMVLGRMLQAASVEAGEKVLDVAAGSGYSSALLAKMGAKVTALESDPAAVQIARAQCGRSGFTLVEGAIDRAPAGLGPFDVILINGACEVDPEALMQALAENGRLVTVFGKGPATYIRLTRRSGQDFGHSRIANASASGLAEFRKTAEFVF